MIGRVVDEHGTRGQQPDAAAADPPAVDRGSASVRGSDGHAGSAYSSGQPARFVEDSSAAWLWTPPDAQPSEPPIVPKPAGLPLDKLSWENAERLFLRLLAARGSVQYAKLYGRRGQDQEGIDAYARLRTSHVQEHTADAAPEGTADAPVGTRSWRPYAVLQSKRVRALVPSDIKNAIDDFLEGTWSEETGTFYYATTYDLTDTRLDAALRGASSQLAKVGIEFVPWGAQEINEMLRPRPSLVDDFFGRAWVEHFCGRDALNTLSTRVEFVDAQSLRRELGALYEAVFNSQNAIRKAATGDPSRDEFIVLDVALRNDEPQGDPTRFDNSARHGATSAGWGLDHAAFPPTHDRGADTVSRPSTPNEDQFVSSSGYGTPRRTLRPVSALLTEESSSADESGFRDPADVWFSRADRNLLVGAPGSGKSSLLRFVALDLLSLAPQSPWIQQEHGGRLPIWLPFGFLCRHLGESSSNSLTSAIRTWMTHHDTAHAWPLVERALADDRLLLLIDGIDEWTSPEAANHALGVIETFLGRTHAAAFLSSRPYAVLRLPWSLTWQRADLLPLDDAQRKRMAAQYLAPPDDAAVHESAPHTDRDPQQSTGEAAWQRANVEPFLAEVTTVPDLSVLTRTPLFLALLSTTWQGEPLPPRRYELYEAIVELLIVRHPQMRRRSSKASDGPLIPRDFRSLIEAVAYSLKHDGHTDPLPTQQMRKRVQEALSDEDILGYPLAEARRMADAALAMAEDEFGLLVSQGADHVGFVHRVIQDHLAGRHLARLTPHEQAAIATARHTDPAWHDVLLSAITAQPNPPAVASLLDQILTASRDHDDPTEWPESLRREQSAYELVANALAAEATLSPRKRGEYLELLVKQVDYSPFLEHRATLITTLVKACTNAHQRHRLLPTFRRWLAATRPFPGPAMFTLHDLPIPDARAQEILIHGMRADAGEVRSNAATAYAYRFGQPTEPLRQPARKQQATDRAGSAPSPLHDQARDDLLTLIRQGPTARAQAAHLLALGLGWPATSEAREHLDWGRRQARTAIRTTALYLRLKANPDATVQELFSGDELAWILDQVREERWLSEHSWTAMTFELVEKAVTDADPPVRAEIADFVLKTLRTNGQTGGDRDLSWYLACRPLAADERLRDWVTSELTSDKERPLIQYNLALIPESWRQHAATKTALTSYIDDQITDTFKGDALPLSRSLPKPQARDALLKGLDAFRPWSIAEELVREFGSDDHVQTELLARFSDDAKAALLSPVALDILGIEEGFERIYTLLTSSHEIGSTLGREEQVLLAQSVATAWREIRDTARSASDLDAADTAASASDTNQDAAQSVPAERIAQSRRILATYTDEQVCTACTQVSSTDFLGWHIDDVINTWPDLTIDYTIAALDDDRHVTDGIRDAIHSAALRAHAGRPSAGSQRVVDLALDLMLFLEPELREVLVHELCRSMIAPDELLDVLSAWRTDKDVGIRRTVIVGVTQALVRHQKLVEASGSTLTVPEMERWRQSVREDLRAYGPTHDEDRQNAWISMLLLGDLTLANRLQETLGEATAPGVRLTDIHGTPDAILVGLIAQNWRALRDHFGDSLVSRLSGSRQQEQDRSEVVAALAVAANRSPEIARLVRDQLREEDEERKESNTPARRRLRLTPTVVDWQKGESGGDRASLEMLLRAADAQSAGRHGSGGTVWALTHLLDVDSWKVSTEDLRTALASGLDEWEWASPQAWMTTDRSVRRAAYSLLFPHDTQTQRWYTALSDWFRSRPTPSGRRPASWLEVSALCLDVAPAEDLPAIVSRMFNPLRVEYLHDSLPELTVPLTHRLHHDPTAVAVLQNTLNGAPIQRTSPLFAFQLGRREAPADATGPTAVEQDTVGRRTFLTALTLKTVGHLERSHLEEALQTLRLIDQRLVVVDPFANQAGPLWAAGETLLPGHP